jgi:2-aminoadipate transaminase
MADTISFARGAPSLDIIDVEGLKACAVEAFDADAARMTAYGTSVGYVPLRQWIAEYHGVEPEQVLVTNGSMQADAFLFDTLVKEGDTVITELPTYDRTLLVLRGRQADVRMVELEPDGIDVAALERVLAAGARPKLAHVIPNFQNPAGYTLSLAKREALIELARTYGFMIFEDDPYVTLRFIGEPLPTMLSMAPDVTVYASSFSKTVCPGIRTGYLVGPVELIATIAAVATSTYISPNMVAGGIVNQFCRSGRIDASIATVRDALRERSQTLCDALAEHIPDARFVAPEGGYFLWVDLPQGTDVNALFDAAVARGVQFVKGSDFVLEGSESSLRLAYSGVTPRQIEDGVRRLAAAYSEIGAATPA